MNKKNSKPKNSSNDVVQRYCPHVGDNVVLLRSNGDNGDTFECLKHDTCSGSNGTECIRNSRSSKT